MNETLPRSYLELKFEDKVWSYFPFLQITFKISFLYVNVYIHWLSMLMRSSKNAWSDLVIFAASSKFLPYLDHTPTPKSCLRDNLITIIWNLKRTFFWELFFSRKFPSTQWMVNCCVRFFQKQPLAQLI